MEKLLIDDDFKEALFIALANIDTKLCEPEQVQFCNYHILNFLKSHTITNLNFIENEN